MASGFLTVGRYFLMISQCRLLIKTTEYIIYFQSPKDGNYGFPGWLRGLCLPINQMHINNEIIRLPDEYGKPVSERNRKKWHKIISLFFENRLNDLALNHRTGTRGRILSVLALEAFNIIQIPFSSEPIFYHTEPNRWYTEFAKKHEIKLRTHDFYNPDLFLEDGTWVEITLSENTAYQKLFRYGHQAENLLLLWLDNDDGFHKETCQHIHFPNARIENIESFEAQLKKTPKGLEIIDKLKVLKELKGIIL